MLLQHPHTSLLVTVNRDSIHFFAGSVSQKVPLQCMDNTTPQHPSTGVHHNPSDKPKGHTASSVLDDNIRQSSLVAQVSFTKGGTSIDFQAHKDCIKGFLGPRTVQFQHFPRCQLGCSPDNWKDKQRWSSNLASEAQVLQQPSFTDDFERSEQVQPE